MARGSSRAQLLHRALAALPAPARAGTVRVRADAGYFAGSLARAALFAEVELEAQAPARAAALRETVTIDLDTSDVEVYGRRKQGVAFNHQGQRVGRPHVASWAETATVLAGDLGHGAASAVSATSPSPVSTACHCPAENR